MLEIGKLYQVKEYDKNYLWLDIVTHGVCNGIVDEDDIFCLIEILPLNCLKILVGDGRVGWIYIHPSNIQKIN
jgi:hypothetical protein